MQARAPAAPATGFARPSRPVATGNVGVINPQYRRSRSAGALKALMHQPVNKIPTGTVYQPQLPKGTKHTTQLLVEDLQRCEQYMVTDQKVDADGNLMENLVKVSGWESSL